MKIPLPSLNNTRRVNPTARQPACTGLARARVAYVARMLSQSETINSIKDARLTPKRGVFATHRHHTRKTKDTRRYRRPDRLSQARFTEVMDEAEEKGGLYHKNVHYKVKWRTKKICQCLGRSKEPNPDSIADVPRSRRETGERRSAAYGVAVKKLTAEQQQQAKRVERLHEAILFFSLVINACELGLLCSAQSWAIIRVGREH